MNLFSSERNPNWLIWIWCIKFHLFLWKPSDVFFGINRFANKFNIYINFVQLCYQFHPPNVLLALFFHAIVLPLSGASLDLWGCRLSSKRGSFSHGGLILCSVLIQKFVHYFFTVNWVVASFVCNEDDIINKVYYFLEFLTQKL